MSIFFVFFCLVGWDPEICYHDVVTAHLYSLTARPSFVFKFSNISFFDFLVHQATAWMIIVLLTNKTSLLHHLFNFSRDQNDFVRQVILLYQSLWNWEIKNNKTNMFRCLRLCMHTNVMYMTIWFAKSWVCHEEHEK